MVASRTGNLEIAKMLLVHSDIIIDYVNEVLKHFAPCIKYFLWWFSDLISQMILSHSMANPRCGKHVIVDTQMWRNCWWSTLIFIGI